MMRKRWRTMAFAIIPVPAALGIVASAILNRTLRPETIPSLYLQADVVAITWIGGVLLSALLAAIAALSIGKNRRDEACRAAIAQAETRAAEIATADAAESRRRFLRRLDHELKNPLTAIHAGLANLTDALLGNALPRDAQPESLDSVKAQTARISRLVSDLRKLAELESRPLERTSVDVAALLAEAIAVVRDLPAAQDRDIALNVPQTPWPLPQVAGDEDLLFLAVYNLLDNALKFTGPGDKVEVRAFEDNAIIVVEVADTGPGISEDDLAHVWEELYRGKEARETPGSGLGLTLVRAVIERHGGQATVRSRAGLGTVFTLKLPAAQ